MDDQQRQDENEIVLGTAAQILFDDGNARAAALLLDARLAWEYRDTGFSLWDDGPPTDLVEAVLEVPRFVVDRFDDDVLSAVRGALGEVVEPAHTHVLDVRVRAAITPAGSGWRKELQQRLAPRATNQASVGPPMIQPLVEDRCSFRSREELAVYRAFRRAQDRLPADDTLALAPNPALVVSPRRTSEPDLLVCYRGRVGLVHVDGPHHHGRYAAEVSHDRVARHSGIAEIDHFLVEDTTDDAGLDVLVDRFLKRLAGP